MTGDSARIKGYAAAVFEMARGEGALERVERELFQIARTFEGSDELRTALTDQNVPTDRKEGIVHDLLGGRASDVTLTALRLMINADRIGDLPAIVDGFVAASAAARSREVAEVRSAVPLDDATVARIQQALSKTTGRQVEVKVVVDPSVLGGIVARVGDMVIDGSVQRRLASVRQALDA